LAEVSDIQDLKGVVLFSLPNENKRDYWDVQITFLLNDLQYTVGFMIQEKNELVTVARSIDTMTPLDSPSLMA
jgi:hypothetical protein